MACPYCNLEFHALCEFPDDTEDCCCGGKGYEPDVIFAGDPRRKKARLEGSMLRDPLSTGRHRAAIRIPEEYFATKPECAWARLAAAGGGVRPIVGCAGNIATDRHHGPDKSVLNNDDDLLEFGVNLHAICDNCHARWHAVNDKFYLPPDWKKGDNARPENGAEWLPVGKPCLPHDPGTFATDILIKAHEKWWSLTPYMRDQLGGYFNDSPLYAGSQPASSETGERSEPVGLSGPDDGIAVGP